jgi:hypothetical protein
MWVVFIPPSYSLQPYYPLGALREKHYLGATIHSSCDNMLRLLANFLANPSMFSKDAFGATMRDTVANANGYGYAALHNIMRAVHPNLVEKDAEPITHYQGNVVKLRLYTKYESLLMVLE